MAPVRKCPRCSQEVADASASICPLCGASLAAPFHLGAWWIALLQSAVVTAFMLLFKFPKWMIGAFGVMILVGTAVSLKARQSRGMVRPGRVGPQQQRPIARPALYRIVSLGIALCALSLFAFALFGFVIFINAWNRWHRYEGQPFHRAEFIVKQAYFQKGLKGSISLSARGTVEGQKEWMNLEPYVGVRLRSQEELDQHVATGSSIPVYLFPDLNGRARVQVVSEPPPAEASRQQAMNAMRGGLAGIAVASFILFVLVRVRCMCYVKASAPDTSQGARA